MAREIRRTPLTTEEIRQARRLKAAYESRKGALGLTQEKLGALLGITQSSTSGCLNGLRAMNDLVVLRFCAVLDIDPETIRPGIMARLPPTSSSTLPVSQQALEFARQFDALSEEDQQFVLSVLKRVRG